MNRWGNNTASKIKTVYTLASLFRSPNIRLEEIDMVYLNDFELFLRKRGNVDNSIATKFTVLKTVLPERYDMEMVIALAFRLHSPAAERVRIYVVQRMAAESSKTTPQIFLSYGAGAVVN